MELRFPHPGDRTHTQDHRWLQSQVVLLLAVQITTLVAVALLAIR